MVQKWANEVQEVVGKDISLVIAGNKYDLINSKDELLKQKDIVEAYCQKENIKHIYTSAKSGDGLNEVFNYITSQVLSKQKLDQPTKKKGIKLESNNVSQETKKSCC